jgi:hypothetical protein
MVQALSVTIWVNFTMTVYCGGNTVALLSSIEKVQLAKEGAMQALEAVPMNTWSVTESAMATGAEGVTLIYGMATTIFSPATTAEHIPVNNNAADR